MGRDDGSFRGRGTEREDFERENAGTAADLGSSAGGKNLKDRRADHRAWRCKIRYDRRTILLRKNHIFSSPVNPAGGSRDETASDRGG